MSLKSLLIPIAAAFGLAVAPASATTLTGVTVVDPTFDLAAAGLTPSLLGDAEVDGNGFLAFPITGGDLGAGLIEHDDSGVRLAATADPSLYIDLENFLIDISDPAASAIFADISTSIDGLIGNAAVFTFDLTTVANPFDLNNPSIELLFSMAASPLIVDFFGLPGNAEQLAGVQFGLAATSPAEIPLPAAVWLFAAGIGGLAFAGRRKKARVAA
jgi:hypothetical protein